MMIAMWRGTAGASGTAVVELLKIINQAGIGGKDKAPARDIPAGVHGSKGGRIGALPPQLTPS
jgi:hypothetical protein